jgi:hypothetical protein
LILEYVVSFLLVFLTSAPIHYVSAESSGIIPHVSESKGTLPDTKIEDILSSTTLAIGDEQREPPLFEGGSSVYKDPVECECVRWIREVKGIPIKGNANTIPRTADKPYAGGVLLMQYGNVSHAAFIVAPLPGCILVEQANKERCKVTTECIPYDSKEIRGYYYANPNQ